MNQLPIVEPDAQKSSLALSTRRVFVHSCRVTLFVTILLVIRYSQTHREIVDRNLAANEKAIELVHDLFGEQAKIGANDSQLKTSKILDEKNNVVGYLAQTSPDCDEVVGYSGPTNCLLAMNLQHQIKGMLILESGDTHDHVAMVNADSQFFAGFNGLGAGSSSADWQKIDGVSGATLTSYSIVNSVSMRLGFRPPALVFAPTPNLEKVKTLFANASVLVTTDSPSLWQVLDANGNSLGTVLTTSPAGDHLMGYQGPTSTLICFDNESLCFGLVVDQSYENDPYSRYADDDYSFLAFYSGKTLQQLTAMDPDVHGIDGVSGATMTSQTIAAAIPLAAQKALSKPPQVDSKRSLLKPIWTYVADGLALSFLIVAIFFSFTRFRLTKLSRTLYLIANVILLGLVSGQMLSLAALLGWTENTIPWRIAPGLVLLCIAALLIPIFSKHQTYCQHLCPFGAFQQLTRNRLGSRLRLPRWIRQALAMVPLALIAFACYVAINSIDFNLASLEPFDAFQFRIAGWITIALFVIGILSSLFIPMAYCRFGCPTGAILNFLKFRADSHRFGARDFLAASLLLLVVTCSFV